MADEAVSLDVDDRVAKITIRREEHRNAIDPGVLQGLKDALERAEGLEPVGVAVLTGAGDRAFCAGGDLSGMDPDGKIAQHFARAGLGELFEQMRRSRLPIVARVNGHALGGGFGLMLACDLVIAAEEAQVGTPEINVGLWPFMVTSLIQRDIPRKIALELMLTGRRMDATEAARWGMVNQVVPRKALDHEVAALCDAMVSKSALIAGLGKHSFYRSEDMEFGDALGYLAGMLSVALSSEDSVEGVSAFIEKRPPRWRNR